MPITIQPIKIRFSDNKNFRSLIFILFFFGSFTAFGQNSDCNCISALEEISELIQQSKSYKIQVKKEDREQEFQQWKRPSAWRYLSRRILQKNQYQKALILTKSNIPAFKLK